MGLEEKLEGLRRMGQKASPYILAFVLASPFSYLIYYVDKKYTEKAEYAIPITQEARVVDDVKTRNYEPITVYQTYVVEAEPYIPPVIKKEPKLMKKHKYVSKKRLMRRRKSRFPKRYEKNGIIYGYPSLEGIEPPKTNLYPSIGHIKPPGTPGSMYNEKKVRKN